MNTQTIVPGDPVDAILPWIDEEERALRQRLHRAWAIGAARATRALSGSARALYWQSAQIASDWTFQPAPAAELKDIADALIHLFKAARTFERIEGPME